jgi:DNA-binding CsgD family transcriptional regulator
VQQGAVLDNLTLTIAELCRRGLEPAVLRDEVLPRLRRAVPFDAAFWTTVDPFTLLLTAPHQRDLPPETVPYLLENEFLGDDVNKFTTLARDRTGVDTLARTTGGGLDASPRFRDVFGPLGFGDELRAVLRSGGVCWGFICLHRGAGLPFSDDEVAYVRRVAPLLAEGIRGGLLVADAVGGDLADAPGLVVVGPGGELVSITDPGRRWLDALGEPDPERHGLPLVVRGLAARAHGADAGAGTPPRLRLRTRTGGWAVLHASRLPGAGEDCVAVIVDAPSPAELAPILMLAYGMTGQEQTVTGLVCRGLSTAEIGDRLRISSHTVQDHLKAIFDKTGVRSRRELVVAILHQQHLPRVAAGVRPGPGGAFRA